MLARYLASNFKARLILTARSALPPRQNWEQWLNTHDGKDNTSQKIKTVKELEASGAEVLVFSADAAHPQQMSNVIQQAEKQFGSINGVIHSAGIMERNAFCFIKETGQKESQRNFQAKVYGLLVLEELLKNKKLDFCWLMSSISTVLGGLGFVSYAAANAFMDAYNNFHNRVNGSNPLWISVDWDGMDADKTVSCFKRILSTGEINRIVVSRGGNLQNRIDKWVKLKGLRDDESPNKKEAAPTGKPRPDLLTPYQEPRTDIETALAGIWQALFGFEKIGTRDDFFELGGDSFKAIQVIEKANRLNINISLTDIMNSRTIEKIAQSAFFINDKNILADKEKQSEEDFQNKRKYNKDLNITYQYPHYFYCYLACSIEKLQYESNMQLERNFLLLAEGRGLFGYFENKKISLKHQFLFPFGKLAGMKGISEILNTSPRMKNFDSFEKMYKYLEMNLSANRLVFVGGSTYFLNYTPDYLQNSNVFFDYLESRPFHTIHNFLLIDILDNGYLIFDPNFDYYGRVPTEDFYNCMKGVMGIEFLQGHPFQKKFLPYQVIEFDTREMREIDHQQLGIDVLKEHIKKFTAGKRIPHWLDNQAFNAHIGLDALKQAALHLKTMKKSPGIDPGIHPFIVHFLIDISSSLWALKDFLSTFIQYHPETKLDQIIENLGPVAGFVDESKEEIEKSDDMSFAVNRAISLLDCVYQNQTDSIAVLKKIVKKL
jgi:hypothetical protein